MCGSFYRYSVLLGDNSEGQLGNFDAYPSSSSPVTVNTLTGGSALGSVVQVDAGYYHTCATLTSGDVYCWGRGSSGQLGDEMYTSFMVASQTLYIDDAVKTVVGGEHTCAAKSDGTIACWGSNSNYQLGFGSEQVVTAGCENSAFGPFTSEAEWNSYGLTESDCASYGGTWTTSYTVTQPPVIQWGSASQVLASGSTLGSNVLGATGNPGWPASIQVTATDANGSVSPETITVTLVKE